MLEFKLEVVAAEVRRREAAPAPQRALTDDYCEADNDDDDAAGGARFLFPCFYFLFWLFFVGRRRGDRRGRASVATAAMRPQQQTLASMRDSLCCGRGRGLWWRIIIIHTTATTSTTNTNTNKIMIINGDGGDDDYDNRTFRPLTWGGDSGACAPGTACGGRKQARLQKPCQARRRTAPSNPCDIRARIRHALQMHPGVSDFGSHASALGVRKTRRALAWSRRASMRRAGLKGCCATAGARGGEAA